MSEFKGTKGEWYYDGISKGIKNNNVKGLLATAWCVYNAEETEIRLDNESWIDMRRRTGFRRQQKEVEKEANAKLISCALEFLENAQMHVDYLDLSDFEFYEKYGFNVSELIPRTRKLIQKATTL